MAQHPGIRRPVKRKRKKKRATSTHTQRVGGKPEITPGSTVRNISNGS